MTASFYVPPLTICAADIWAAVHNEIHHAVVQPDAHGYAKDKNCQKVFQSSPYLPSFSADMALCGPVCGRLAGLAVHIALSDHH